MPRSAAATASSWSARRCTELDGSEGETGPQLTVLPREALCGPAEPPPLPASGTPARSGSPTGRMGRVWFHGATTARGAGAPASRVRKTSTMPRLYQPRPGDPWVLLSLSTTLQRQAEALPAVLAALAGLPVRVMLTLGGVLPISAVDAPPNVTVRGYLAHDLVLPHMRAVITHGGLSTITTSLAAGLPCAFRRAGSSRSTPHALRPAGRAAGWTLTRLPLRSRRLSTQCCTTSELWRRLGGLRPRSLNWGVGRARPIWSSSWPVRLVEPAHDPRQRISTKGRCVGSSQETWRAEGASRRGRMSSRVGRVSARRAG